MADARQPPEAPRRPAREYEDNHYHDEDEVAQVPADDVLPLPRRSPSPPSRKLPPPKRRFHEE
jgi:hypothetical protein